MSTPLAPQELDVFLACLDCDRAQACTQYEQIRNRLVRFFEWRGAESVEGLVDETINRVARHIADGLVIRSELYAYVCCVARIVHLEDFRRSPQERKAAAQEDGLTFEKFLNSALTPDERSLFLRYHSAEPGQRLRSRKELSEELGIPMNALRIRVYRLRRKLEEARKLYRLPAEPVTDSPMTPSAKGAIPGSPAPVSTQPVHHQVHPLDRLRRHLQTFVPVLYAQVLEPTLADLWLEHSEALQEGNPRKARWILVRGYGALTAAAVRQFGISLLGRIASLWQAKSPK